MAAQKKGIFGKADGSPQMGDDDQAFLSQIEETIRSKGNEQLDAQEEAQQRAEEMERIRKASGSIPVPGRSAAPPASKPSAPDSKKSNPLENDPRYREYFERLRKQRGESSNTTPGAGVTQQATGEEKPGAAASQKVGPGSIVCFDDKSIGIYKDAVSGRDYALFYFLNPDGSTMPEGVFLQCYQAKVIGVLPEPYFAELRDADAWNRDMIVFHLAKYDFVKHLDTLAEHQERKPSATKPRNQTIEARDPAEPEVMQRKDNREKSEATAADTMPQSHGQPPADPAEPAEEPSSEGLVKGRRFHIKFGGKQWEAVYWTSEDENSIVAHNTHGNWSLMRLDLSRFKDSLELLELVDNDTLSAIAEQAAAGG